MSIISGDLAHCLRKAGSFKCPAEPEGRKAAIRALMFVADVTMGNVTAISAEIMVVRDPDDFLRLGTELLKQLCFTVDFGSL